MDGPGSSIHFEEATVGAFSGIEPFDMVIGRYVLIHQADPAAFLRRVAELARPGGVIAFHELCIREQVVQSLPSVPLWQQAGEWIAMAFQAVAPHCDAGGILTELTFTRAGLSVPNLSCECLVGGGEDSPLYALIASTLEGVIPQLVRMRILTEGTIVIETLEDRLRTAVVEARSQLVGSSVLLCLDPSLRVTGSTSKTTSQARSVEPVPECQFVPLAPVGEPPALRKGAAPRNPSVGRRGTGPRTGLGGNATLGIGQPVLEDDAASDRSWAGMSANHPPPLVGPRPTDEEAQRSGPPSLRVDYTGNRRGGREPAGRNPVVRLEVSHSLILD